MSFPETDAREVDRSKDRRWRQKSAAEIEAVSRVADCLFELERREVLADEQILLLAQAIDALELGAFEAAAPLTDQARAAGPQPVDLAGPRDRARALVQGLALKHLRGKFLRLAGAVDPTSRWR